eukprot:1380730-Amorphochlora_amoeboformis.AAC.2
MSPPQYRLVAERIGFILSNTLLRSEMGASSSSAARHNPTSLRSAKLDREHDSFHHQEDG